MKHGRYWALAAASVAVLVFGSAQTTGALWRDEETLDGGTLDSGTLDIKLGPQGSAEVQNFPIPGLGNGVLAPNGFAQAPLLIRNNGTTPFVFRLQNTTVNGPLPFVLTASTISSTGSCPATGAPTGASVLYNANAAGAQIPVAPAARLLAPGSNEVWCFRLTTSDSPPQTATSTVTFSFRADQA
ncbi:hypothetical protein QM588_19115 [Rhodococcus sp. IEGM 1354]|uniref:hypothetical protein n=1 Tax=Nocardiaceae TaxID=85025 RepID=UPI00050CD6FE|nr:MULTISPECIES: hypothetical protein [Rhodococcus]MBY4109347.1 hypothetical protein [Rhodococcus fascians]MBY4113158.1 hypothetical protein [Rhodococcus fascians]MDI9932531.1 hypothetical protein [Rhodococcus sp. IEGM 1354]